MVMRDGSRARVRITTASLIVAAALVTVGVLASSCSGGWTVDGAGHLHEGHRTHPAAFVSELSPPEWRIGTDGTDHV
jgi:hypothetical protein